MKKKIEVNVDGVIRRGVIEVVFWNSAPKRFHSINTYYNDSENVLQCMSTKEGISSEAEGFVTMKVMENSLIKKLESLVSDSKSPSLEEKLKEQGYE